MIKLPFGGVKTEKSSKHNALLFAVLEGFVEVTISETTFRIHRAGHFFVPRGNFYAMKNVGKKEALLFFSQATDTMFNLEKEEEKERLQTEDQNEM